MDTRARNPFAPLPAIANIEELRYPDEPDRFNLALLASGGFLLLLVVAVAAGSESGLLSVVVFAAAVPAAVWIALQVARARLMGRSVRVTGATFPEIQSELERVCAQLDYRKPVEVYVTEKGDPPVSSTNYLGTRIILMQGDLVASLRAAPMRPQLTFLLAREVGALKARHSRLQGALLLLAAANALQFVRILVTPYYRTTAYSGDQIGLVACGSLDAALHATGRLLVGGELASRLPVGGVLPQALSVRRGGLTRLVELFSEEPHATSRYANLLAFAHARSPETVMRLRSSLDPVAAAHLDEVLLTSAHARPATPRTTAPPHTASYPPPAPHTGVNADTTERRRPRFDFPPPQPGTGMTGA